VEILQGLGAIVLLDTKRNAILSLNPHQEAQRVLILLAEKPQIRRTNL
jgi:hypothetical protein